MSAHSPRFKGIFPVVPTTFSDDGRLDLDSQKRCVDFMIDAGSNGLCILANFSEQFAIADDERELVTRTVLEHVAGRVPVIVTTGTATSAFDLRDFNPLHVIHKPLDTEVLVQVAQKLLADAR